MDSYGLWRGEGIALTPDMLRARVRETQHWCHQQVEAGTPHSMRSEALTFELLHNGRLDAVTSLGLNRSRALWSKEPTAQQDGRFFVYFPDEQLADGAAEVASEGFFDVFNAPPWDTWISYFEDGSYLLCWVPEPFEALVAEGIWVNPEECIRWIEDTDVPVKSQLAKLGLLGTRPSKE